MITDSTVALAPASPPDEGVAYHLKSSYDTTLTEVGKGTPCGEYLRRFWHPVAISEDAGSKPRKIRMLGEDLVLFRDAAGSPGLLHARCCHRGTSLYYGRVEDDGIRCCYHGWKFDTTGHCLDQPCEPGGGLHRNRARQPWYPVVEQYGLIFAYMGPPEKKPLPPRFDNLELRPGEIHKGQDMGISTGGFGKNFVAPCNWLQHWENVVDPFHVPVLHASFSGTQFNEEMGRMPEVSFETVHNGIKLVSYRDEPGLAEGQRWQRVTQILAPTLKIVGGFVPGEGQARGMGWAVPVDDTHYRALSTAAVNPADWTERRGGSVRPGGRFWIDMTDDERRDAPGDYEAQVGQGPITLHSEEHLATSDQGIVKARRFLREQIALVQAGKDPVGVAFTPEDQLVHIDAGSYIV